MLRRPPFLLIFSEAAIVVLVLAYMAAFPIFPEIRSVDFGQHLSLASSLAAGQIPPLSSQLLYYGVEWYLAAFLALFRNADPFVVTRWAMAVFVTVSPVIVYVCSKAIFAADSRRRGERDAIAMTPGIITLVYSVSGLVWVQMVFISGIYANFYGVLASLGLIAAAVWYCRIDKLTARHHAILGLVLTNALFSHYSVLLVFPPLLIYVLIKKKWDAFAILYVPIGAGILLFSGFIATLFGFFAPTANVIPQPSTLSPYLVLPSLRYLAEEVTDWQFLFMFACVIPFIYLAAKRRDGRMLLVVSWFLVALLAAPLNDSAWRFALDAVMPATLMIGFILARIPVLPFLPTSKRNLLIVALLIVPVFFPSWGYYSFDHATSYPGTQDQQYVYEALQWIGRNVPVPVVCHEQPGNPLCKNLVALTDWRLTYAPLFNGSQVLYAPDYGVVATSPFQMALFAASHNSTYLIVTNDEYGVGCNPAGAVGLTISADTRQTPANTSVSFTASASGRLNGSVNVFDNGIQVGTVELTNGTADFIGQYPKYGFQSVALGVGQVMTRAVNITVTSGPDPVTSQSATVPAAYCLPWDSFNYATLTGFTLAYSNPFVKIWQAPG